MRSRIDLLVLVLALISFTSAENGFDMDEQAGDVPRSTFECLYQSGLEFALLQIWDGDRPNNHFKNNYKRAQAAHIDHVDAFATICSLCEPNVDLIVSSIESNLPPNFQGRVFLQPDNRMNTWGTDTDSNMDYLKDLATALHDKMEIGIFANPSIWSSVFKDVEDDSPLNEIPLWYAAEDHDDSVDKHLKMFGDWKDYEGKQYKRRQHLCGTVVNFDFVNEDSPHHSSGDHHSDGHHSDGHHSDGHGNGGGSGGKGHSSQKSNEDSSLKSDSFLDSSDDSDSWTKSGNSFSGTSGDSTSGDSYTSSGNSGYSYSSPSYSSYSGEY